MRTLFSSRGHPSCVYHAIYEESTIALVSSVEHRRLATTHGKLFTSFQMGSKADASTIISLSAHSIPVSRVVECCRSARSPFLTSVPTESAILQSASGMDWLLSAPTSQDYRASVGTAASSGNTQFPDIVRRVLATRSAAGRSGYALEQPKSRRKSSHPDAILPPLE